MYVVPPSSAEERWLAGPGGIQPFEQALLAGCQSRYLVIQREGEREWRLLVPPGDRADAGGKDTRLVKGHALPPGWHWAVPGYHDGFWFQGPSSIPLRIFDGKVIECTYEGSPLKGLAGGGWRIIEDCARNLWITERDGSGYLFRRLYRDLTLSAAEAPDPAYRFVEIAVVVGGAPLSAPPPRLFWRFKGESWRGGDTKPALTVRFDEEGLNEIEVLAMDSLGVASPNILRVAIQVEIGFPETLLTATGPFASRDIVWGIPAAAVACAPPKAGLEVALSYRIDGGDWQRPYEGDKIFFRELDAGTYRVEVAAVDSDGYRDPTPEAFDIEYAPDFERAVADRIELMLNGSTEQRHVAFNELQGAGGKVYLLLQARQREAARAARLGEDLDSLLKEIEEDRGPQH